MKRLTAIVIVICICVSCFFSCSQKSPVVMTVGDFKVSYDLLRYFVLNYMNGYEGLGPDDFRNDPDLAEALRKNVLKSVSELAAYKLLANEYKLELTASEKESVQASLDMIRADYSTDEDYRNALKDNYLTEDVLKEIYEIQAICDRLYEYMTDEYYGRFKSDTATVEADIEAGNWFATEYIVLSYGADGQLEERRQFASELHDSVVKGERTLSQIYEEYRTSYGVGINYCRLDAFTYSQEKKYFEDAVLALNIGDISDVIESEDGLLIIKRIPIDDEYIDQQFISVFVSGYLEREFFKYVDEYAENLEIRFKRKYKDLKFEDIT
ncbi:MAG: peptidylprolyl isomerase [Clostridia bacterium]|nr:peptidylprolyl isomerase [Clostridia bacterium]